MKKLMKKIVMPKEWMILCLILVTVVLIVFGIYEVSARRSINPKSATSALHPVFVILDENGVSVIKSGQPVSTMKTCGECHDTNFIASHSFHSDLGLSDIQSGKPSSGIFGQWDPLYNRVLSQPGDSLLDLGTPGWIIANAQRFVGGGPGTTSRTGTDLEKLVPSTTDPETSILNSSTGKVSLWDWTKSGTIEMDCFLCHFSQPDNQARIQAIQAGQFAWSNTATLQKTGLVEKSSSGWTWNPAAFDANGQILPEYVTLQDPTNDNCAQCHGLVHMDKQTPLTLPGCTDLSYSQTATTGQVVSPQKISESGVNSENKDTLSRAWDVHAERQVACVDCHYSINNPIYYQESAATKPGYLTFDPRRLDFSEYLVSPDHDFARGQSAQFNIAPQLKGTMRRCESCHDALTTHASWLPYTPRHMAILACETCHIPKMYAPAIQSYDWTVINLNSEPNTTCRGTQGSGDLPTDLVSGYQPVLMQRTNIDGGSALAPYNLVTSFYWTYEDGNGKTVPVRQIDLEAAFLQNGQYVSAILSAFDTDQSGKLDSNELKIDTTEKQSAVATRLSALGLKDPQIQGQVQPYSINHDVTRAEWAIADCKTCHTTSSRLTNPIELAAYAPAGVIPAFVSGTNVSGNGQILTEKDSSLVFQPSTKEENRYIFGQSRVSWVDWFGGIFFLLVLVAVGSHSGMRAFTTLRQPKHEIQLKKVYLYQAYERFWHWLQTTVIVLLLFTGLIMHRPDIFSIFSFRGMVTMHNVLWVILALNAAFSLFYHLASGQIKQFIPHPYGFFDDAILQTRYYLAGIFKHEPHPFEKTPERKMNPLQQVTYVGILNILLPLQGLTGILMWGVQKWPNLASRLGGLPFLAPFHTLIAWIFAAFIVGHVYLTTTGGSKPLDSIKGMVTGWEEVETHDLPGEAHLEKENEE